MRERGLVLTTADEP